MRGEPFTISVAQAARQLGVSRSYAYRLARNGELPGAFHLGPGRVRVSVEGLRAFLASTGRPYEDKPKLHELKGDLA